MAASNTNVPAKNLWKEFASLTRPARKPKFACLLSISRHFPGGKTPSPQCSCTGNLKFNLLYSKMMIVIYMAAEFSQPGAGLSMENTGGNPDKNSCDRSQREKTGESSRFIPAKK
ncbi:hypothetical protein [Terriglobus albidus]|uniref:hypothetical protein n=1 Tax=Terriglobus albidus TaxID=1592106 RepID=UPI0021DFF054|nr:hypothetical protein [Terriglobus albidus]